MLPASDRLRKYILSVKGFSGCVLLARAGEILLHGAYGYADEERAVPATEETRFYAGSITKSLTAVCLMRLVEAGRVRLTDGLEEYFPHIHPDQGITIHHLLSHTSGLMEPFRIKEVLAGVDLGTSEIVRVIAEQKLLFRPGTKWHYSNANYMLVGLICEQVTGMALHDYIRTHILRPLGMNDTFFCGEPVDHVANSVTPVFHVTPAMTFAAGDLISTAQDLYRYDQALYGEQLVGQQSIERMMTPAYRGAFLKYGYGWFINRHFNRKSVSHGGFLPDGHTAHLERYLEERATVIVLSNRIQRYSRLGVKYFNSTDVARELSAALFGCKARPWQKLY